MMTKPTLNAERLTFNAQVGGQVELPLEYLVDREDRRTVGNAVAGVFVNRMLRDQTERFLSTFNVQPSTGRRPS